MLLPKGIAQHSGKNGLLQPRAAAIVDPRQEILSKTNPINVYFWILVLWRPKELGRPVWFSIERLQSLDQQRQSL